MPGGPTVRRARRAGPSGRGVGIGPHKALKDRRCSPRTIVAGVPCTEPANSLRWSRGPHIRYPWTQRPAASPPPSRSATGRGYVDGPTDSELPPRIAPSQTARARRPGQRIAAETREMHTPRSRSAFATRTGDPAAGPLPALPAPRHTRRRFATTVAPIGLGVHAQPGGGGPRPLCIAVAPRSAHPRPPTPMRNEGWRRRGAQPLLSNGTKPRLGHHLGEWSRSEPHARRRRS